MELELKGMEEALLIDLVCMLTFYHREPILYLHSALFFDNEFTKMSYLLKNFLYVRI